MKIRNIGKNTFIVDRIKQGNGFIHQVIKPGKTEDVEQKKAEKLLKTYPDHFVKDGMIVQAPSDFEVAKKVAAEKAAADAKAEADAAAKAAADAKKNPPAPAAGKPVPADSKAPADA